MSDSSPPAHPTSTASEALALVRALNNKVKRTRSIKNKITSFSMAVGCISVILAIVLLFFYLAYVVVPLFYSPEMEKTSNYPIPAAAEGKTLHLAVEEQNTIAVRFTDQAKAVFFNVKNGQVVESVDLSLANTSKVSSFTTIRFSKGFFVVGLGNGKVLFVST